MKIFIALLLVAQILLANGPTLKESEYKYVEPSIGKGKPYFLELGAESCRSCQIMGNMLYRVKKENRLYNIHFINVKRERGIAQKLEIRMIPTQIIYDKEGKEVYRHIGVLGTGELNELFKKYEF
jgi:thioredoxin 1